MLTKAELAAARAGHMLDGATHRETPEVMA